MVKLKGPGLARSASGSLAETVTFSHCKGVAYLKKYAKPNQPRSQGQVSVRAITKLLSTDWKNFTAPQKNSWAAIAAQTLISPFNACVSFNLHHWALYKFASRIYPATRTGSPHTGVHVGAVQHGQGILLSFDCSTVHDGWGCSWHHVPNWGDPATYLNCIQQMILTSPGEVTWLWKPLDPGTYNFRAILFTQDGNDVRPGGVLNCVVT